MMGVLLSSPNSTMTGRGPPGDARERKSSIRGGDAGIGLGKESILAIAMTVLVSISSSGCLHSFEDYANHQIWLESGVSSSESYRIGDSLYWDATFEITDPTHDSDATWKDMNLTIIKFGEENGTVYRFEPGPVYRTENVTVYYLERAGGKQGPNYGDSFQVTGLTRAHQGSRLVIKGYMLVGFAKLPDAWKDAYSLSLSRSSSVLPNSWTMVPNISMTVVSVEPDWEKVRWSDLGFRFESWDDDQLIPFTPSSLSCVTVPGPGIYYWEGGRSDGCIEPGEHFTIVRMPGSWFGEKGQIVTGEVEVTNLTLPSSFPAFNVTVELTFWKISCFMTTDGPILNRLYINISSLEPAEAVIPWGGSRLKVMNESGRELFMAGPRWGPHEYYGNEISACYEDNDQNGLISLGDNLIVSGGSSDVPKVYLSFSIGNQWLASGLFDAYGD